MRSLSSLAIFQFLAFKGDEHLLCASESESSSNFRDTFVNIIKQKLHPGKGYYIVLKISDIIHELVLLINKLNNVNGFNRTLQSISSIATEHIFFS